MNNYWSLVISSRISIHPQQPSAEYIVATNEKSVAKDLAGGFTLLDKYLKRAKALDAREYVRKHPILAEALLAALIAMSDCLHRLNVSPPDHPPQAIACSPPGEDYAPVASIFADYADAKLWMKKSPEERTQA